MVQHDSGSTKHLATPDLSTIRPHEPPPQPPPAERWDAELERRRLILGIPPWWGAAEVAALAAPFVGEDHDLDIHVDPELCPDAAGAFVTMPGYASADGLRMALDGLEVDGHRLAVRNAKPSRRRVLNHSPEAQSHRAGKYHARERRRRRREDARTAGLRAAGHTYRAIADMLGRCLAWVQRSLWRFDRGFLTPTCSELGHAPCREAPDGVYRVSSNDGASEQIGDRDRLSDSNLDHESMGEGNTRARTAPDTPPRAARGALPGWEKIGGIWERMGGARRA